jgi:hypothetical protein
MKNILQSSPFILVFFGIITTANANPYIYSNSISAHNIATIQHKITQTVFNTGAKEIPTNTPQEQSVDPTKTYGQAPVYGTLSTYGEYNVFGRSGGEKPNPALSDLWFNWQNITDNVKFDNSTPIDTKINLVTAGLMGDTYVNNKTTNTWGLYTGYIHTTQEIPDFRIQSNGGYFGLYNGTTIGNFGVKFTLNGGLLNNSSNSPFVHENHTNFWIGGAINTSYAIRLDDSFMLRPALHIGYTWVKSDDFIDVANSDFNFYELTPAIDAIKHIGAGWYGSIGLKYVTIHSGGGTITFNNQDVPELDMGNFYEYGLAIYKSISSTHFSAHIGRHDGARYGWFGNINIKYLF